MSGVLFSPFDPHPFHLLPAGDHSCQSQLNLGLASGISSSELQHPQVPFCFGSGVLPPQ